MTLTQEQIAFVRSLETEEGQITPDLVIAAARKKDSPIHDLFEWDKNKAAMMQWIHQARLIIGAVTIVVTNTTSTVKTPFYVRDPDAEGQGYKSVVALKANPEKARESLVYTLSIAAGHVRRAYDLAVPLGMESEVDQLLALITGLQRSIQSKAA